MSSKRSDAVISFGSQVRSYVLQPYQLVKDLRTGESTTDVEAVLDGALDAFMEAEIVRRATAPRGNPNAAMCD